MKIGIIGGSGLDDPKILENYETKETHTPYGKPSSSLTLGKINDIEVVILARHGKQHTIPPTHVNNRANIYALKQEKCTHIISTTAVGSLKKEIERGDFIILDQFIDFTRHRQITFYDEFSPEKGPAHTPMAFPFSKFLRKRLIKSCQELNYKYHEKGTVITIEGPRFSTFAESKMFQQWGADVINMSIAPEATLANEIGIKYAAIAMSTDYDCWKQDEEPVTWEQVLKIFNNNAEKVKKLIIQTISKFNTAESDFIKSKIRTIPDFPKPGIMFRDITTLLKDREGMNKVIEIFMNRYSEKKIDVVAGIESRGFIIGAILASRLNVGFVPIRKSGKLPGEKISEKYQLEYGEDSVEIHKDAIQPGQKVLIIDDLIATSGTLVATCQLIERLGGKIEECGVIIELEDLGGREKLSDKGYKLFNIVSFRENE